MTNESILITQADRKQALIIQSPQLECDSCFANVPVLPETLLLIDLEIQEASADLGRLTEIILGDLGATIQILQLTNCMYDIAGSRSRRIEDRISDLELNVCLEVLSEKIVCHGKRYRDTSELWAHSREIAHSCRVIAEETRDFHPNDAYLLGLFHAVGSLPAALGWDNSQWLQMDSALVGVKLVKQWPLPYCVEEFFHAQIVGLQTRQMDIVQKAHQSVNRSFLNCVSRKRMHGQFLHAI